MDSVTDGLLVELSVTDVLLMIDTIGGGGGGGLTVPSLIDGVGLVTGRVNVLFIEVNVTSVGELVKDDDVESNEVVDGMFILVVVVVVSEMWEDIDCVQIVLVVMVVVGDIPGIDVLGSKRNNKTNEI